MKRKHGIENFPIMMEAIKTGKYTVREPEDKKKYSSSTWKLFRFIFDENEVMITDHFFCCQCQTIFNLSLSNSGQCLKRHAEKCVVPSGATIQDFFVTEVQSVNRLKIKKEDRHLVRDAAIAFIVKDMRPIQSINGEGMASMLSTFTYIGAKYGHIPKDVLPKAKLIPSRQTVSVWLSIYIRIRFASVSHESGH